MARVRRCFYYPPINPSRGRLGSRYGVRPGRLSREPTFHAGLDFSIGEARPGEVTVFSICDAKIEDLPSDSVTRGPFAGYGNAVVLRCVGRDEGYWILYAHLHNRPAYLNTFKDRDLVVPAGTMLGTVGKTSNGKFSRMHWHLHLEIRRARRDGSSPFPGPYGPSEIPAGIEAGNLRRGYNVDPEKWLEARGLAFGYRGAIQLVRPGTCLPSLAKSKDGVERALDYE